MLHPGLYEQVINNALTGELAEIPEARKSVVPIDKAEASKVLAQYLTLPRWALTGGQSSFLRFYGRPTRGWRWGKQRRT